MTFFRFLTISFALVVFINPFKTSAQSSDSLVTQLARKWENAKVYALKMAELMPEAFYDFKPVPEEMSFREQLLHIAQNMQWLSTSYFFEDKNKIIIDAKPKDKASVIKELSDAYDIGLNAHKNIKAKQLDEVLPFFAGPMSRRQILILMHDHQTHHVGQLIVYLRLKGIKPPDYVGW